MSFLGNIKKFFVGEGNQKKERILTADDVKDMPKFWEDTIDNVSNLYDRISKDYDELIYEDSDGECYLREGKTEEQLYMCNKTLKELLAEITNISREAREYKKNVVGTMFMVLILAIVPQLFSTIGGSG